MLLWSTIIVVIVIIIIIIILVIMILSPFCSYDEPDMSLEKRPYDEKKGESHHSEEKPKSNIYMTLSELGDFN